MIVLAIALWLIAALQVYNTASGIARAGKPSAPSGAFLVGLTAANLLIAAVIVWAALVVMSR